MEVFEPMNYLNNCSPQTWATAFVCIAVIDVICLDFLAFRFAEWRSTPQDGRSDFWTSRYASAKTKDETHLSMQLILSPRWICLFAFVCTVALALVAFLRCGYADVISTFFGIFKFQYAIPDLVVSIVVATLLNRERSLKSTLKEKSPYIIHGSLFIFAAGQAAIFHLGREATAWFILSLLILLIGPAIFFLADKD